MKIKALLIGLLLLLVGVAPSFAEKCLPQERVTIEGRLVEIRHPIALIAGKDGKHYRIRLGPYWYWKQKGYKLSPGDEVRVLGFKRGRLVFPIAIESQGKKYLIRDKCGVPLWRKK